MAVTLPLPLSPVRPVPAGRTALGLAVVLAGAAALGYGGAFGAAAVLAALLGGVFIGWLSRGRDATAILTVHVVVLILVPSRFVVGPLGAAGSLAGLISLFLFTWWAVSRLTPGVGAATGLQPVRYAIFAWLLTFTASYCYAFLRPLEAVQRQAADRWVLTFVGLAGLALVCADGIPTYERLVVLIKRVTAAIAALAVIVFLQFQGIFDWATINWPGLTANFGPYSEVRYGFTRAYGSTAHPIEASVIMAMGFVLALTFLFHAPDTRSKRRWMVATAMIALGIPMTVSRSGVVSLAVGLLVLVPTWPPALRWRAAVVGALGLVVTRAAFPGLLGTVRGLFTFIGVDTSVTARTDDYAPVFRLIYDHPVIGIGPGLFLPELYFFLDNQFLFTLIEQGAVGLVMLFVLPTVAVGAVRVARRRSQDPARRALAQSIAAAILAGFASFATFDAFSFPTFAALWWLLIGACGAMWRLTRLGDDTPAGPGMHVPVLLPATAPVGSGTAPS